MSLISVRLDSSFFFLTTTSIKVFNNRSSQRQNQELEIQRTNERKIRKKKIIILDELISVFFVCKYGR